MGDLYLCKTLVGPSSLTDVAVGRFRGPAVDLAVCRGTALELRESGQNLDLIHQQKSFSRIVAIRTLPSTGLQPEVGKSAIEEAKYIVKGVILFGFLRGCCRWSGLVLLDFIKFGSSARTIMP